jgi:transcriptional regulator with XRE-family HTH domain
MAEQPALGFAGLLRQLRAEARLTQEELAEAATVSPRSVSDLERGINRTARKDTAVLLASALGLAAPVRPVFVAAARGRVPAAEVLAAMRGEASSGAEASAPGGDPLWAGCPYLGLVPFEEKDARLFYGRTELVGQLVRRLSARLDGTGIVSRRAGPTERMWDLGKTSLPIRVPYPLVPAGCPGGLDFREVVEALVVGVGGVREVGCL